MLCCGMMSVAYTGVVCFFFFKQKTAYEMRISDWSSDVCSSDLRDVLCGDRDRAGADSALLSVAPCRTACPDRLVLAARGGADGDLHRRCAGPADLYRRLPLQRDRKSTRLNSRH